MALRRSRLSDIPEDAIVLSKKDAVEYQMEIIQNWTNRKDVFFIRYGTGILGGAASIAGMYLNNYYRNKLRLGSFGLLSSYLGLTAIPAGLCMTLHYTFVVPSLILRDRCAVCTEMRASSHQAMFGCAIPTLLAPAAGFSTALNYGTYNVPYLTQPLQVLALWWKFTKGIRNTLLGIFLVQALLAAGITVLQAKDFETVNAKLDMRGPYEIKNIS